MQQLQLNEYIRNSKGIIFVMFLILSISYFSFLGVSYYLNGDFEKTFVLVFVEIIIMFISFICPQYLRRVHSHFWMSIILEFILFLSMPIVLTVSLLPVYHFYKVYQSQDEIVKQFDQSISKSKNMFVDYEAYCHLRRGTYWAQMRNAVKSPKSKFYNDCHFVSNYEKPQMLIRIENFDNHFLSQNYISLRDEAVNWINSVSSVSVWNVFVLGNMKQVESALVNWRERLIVTSQVKLEGENSNYPEFDKEGASIGEITNSLNSLSSLYVKFKMPNTKDKIVYGVTWFLLLILIYQPYHFTPRHSKSPFRKYSFQKK